MRSFIKMHMPAGIFIPLFFIIMLLSVPFRVCSYAGLPDKAPDASHAEHYIYGFAYKAVWNKDAQALLITNKGEKVLLYFDNKYKNTDETNIRSGSYVKLNVSESPLLLPKKATNFGGFDQTQYLASKGVKYISYIKKATLTIYGTSAEIISDANSGANSDFKINFSLRTKAFGLRFFTAIRNSMQNAFSDMLGSKNAAVAMGILTGSTGEISSEDMQMYRDAGIAHVMAASGMHIGFVQKFSMKAFSRRRISFAVRRALCLICLIIFAGMADFSASVTRALLQSAYFLVGGILRRPCCNKNAFMLSASLQLAANPYNIYNSGFVLSYAAAASILITAPSISKLVYFGKRLPESISAGIAISIGTTPALIQYFNTISPVGIILTVAASRLAYWICLPGFIIWLSCLLPFGVYLAKIPSAIMSVSIYGLNAVSRVGSGVPAPLGAFRIPSMSAYAVIIYYTVLCIIAILFFKKNSPDIRTYIKNIILKHRISSAVAAAIAFILIFAFKLISSYGTEIMFFDVGQGFSALIKSKNICGLIDTGDGKTDVSSLIYKQGVGTIDFILITHGHADHTGGIYDIMEEHNVGCIILPDNPYDTAAEEIKEKAEEKNIDVICISGTQKYKFGDMDVILYANQEYMTSDKSGSINNSSVVMYVKSMHGSVLFTGDIEKESETKLAEAGYVNDTDVLAVAHHGSDTSSAPKNVSIISPEYAIISVGRNNSYGHPSESVENVLEETGAVIRRTDMCGDIGIKMRKGKLYTWQKLTT